MGYNIEIVYKLSNMLFVTSKIHRIYPKTNIASKFAPENKPSQTQKERIETFQPSIFQVLLLMVQNSGNHQLRLVDEIPLFATGFLHPNGVFFRRVSEPSTVC